MKCSGVTITVNEPILSTFVNIRALKYRKSPKSLLKVGTRLTAGHNIWVATWKSNQECGFLWAKPAPSVQVHESSTLKWLRSYSDVMKTEHKFLGWSRWSIGVRFHVSLVLMPFDICFAVWVFWIFFPSSLKALTENLWNQMLCEIQPLLGLNSCMHLHMDFFLVVYIYIEIHSQLKKGNCPGCWVFMV